MEPLQSTDRTATRWLKLVHSIEALEDVDFDEQLIARLEGAAARAPLPEQVYFHNPSFKSCHTDELGACNKNSWPAVSITGGNCQLQCEHCKAGILKPMLAATSPDALWRLVNDLIDNGAQGILLTGGSNHRNEIDYRPYWPVISLIKRNYPWFELTCHTALIDNDNALRMADAGVDVAMMDVIGARDTIRRVYHLKREVEDFDASLAALCRTSMQVVPHIVMGLHFGKLLGEWRALEIVKQHPVDGLVLVSVMPHFASSRFQSSTLSAPTMARFLLHTRKTLPALPLSLGCARPSGVLKAELDTYAVMAGVNRIAHPAEGVVQLAQRLGRKTCVSSACCSVATEIDKPVLHGKIMNITGCVDKSAPESGNRSTVSERAGRS